MKTRTTMKGLLPGFTSLALAAVLPGLAGAAEFPSAVDGVLTLDVSGSATYDQALPSGVSRLVKTGTGEAVLTTATTAFDGTVDVQAGTLTLKDAAAVGADTKIEVTGDAATLHLNFAQPAGAGDVFFAGHDVTIRGKGADGKGAFRYTHPDGKSADQMLESLTLSGDAAIAVPTRFGIGKALNLNGHVLTRADGTGTWAWNSPNLAIGAGVISNLVGDILWQKDPTFAEPEKTRLYMDAGKLSAWYVGTLPCAVVFNGGELKGTGSSTMNVLSGPVKFLKALTISRWDATDAIGFSGDVTGEVPADNATTLNGKGTCRFDGTFATAGSFSLSGEASVSGDFTVGNTLRLPKSGSAVFRQTAGQLNVTKPGYGWVTIVGENSGAYGRYVMTGGTASFAGAPKLGANAGSVGLFWQEGGLVESTNGVVVGGSGRGLVGVTGGAKFKAVNADTYALPLAKLAAASGGSGALAVSGEGSAFEAGSLAMGAEDGSDSSSALAVTDGGVLKAGRLYCVARTAGADVAADVCFDGGVLMPTRWKGFENGKASPRHWEVGPKGMTIDLSELRGDSAADEMTRETELTWKHPLSDLSGHGIASVSLPADDAAFAAEVYRGPVLVDVEGPSGAHGAVALAECDAATRKLTGVRVFAGGSGYDATTKVYVHSETNRTVRYECAYALTAADRAGGRLVKRGDRTLRLCGTYACTGGLSVEEGALVLSDGAALPAGTPLTVGAGATFTADGQDVTVSTLAGVGGAVSCKSLTVTKELEITVADLFAADASPTVVNTALSFGEGVAVKIVDPENLAAHADDRSRAVLRATGGLTGAVPVLSGAVGEKWHLVKSGNTLKFGPRRGICLIVR